MNDIAFREYWSEIAAIAASVSAEAKAGNRDAFDVLHEAIDGHQWVIYTFYNFDVAKHSPNDGAWKEAYASREQPDNFDSVRAFFAMVQDVTEHTDFISDPENENDDDDD